MTIQEMKQKKEELMLTDSQLARLTGLSLQTIESIFGGSGADIPYADLRELRKVFEAADTYACLLKKASTTYLAKHQGTYTLDDYYRLPETQRVELIDGVIYDMGAPTSAHQLIAGYVHSKFMDYTMKKKGPCLPIISPIDVPLDRDEKTMVQPDVIIVCKRDIVINRCVYGAPSGHGIPVRYG